jgi:16S rRNA processing protein RimM
VASAELIETGEIVRAHGTRGEVRVKPWANSPESLLELDTLYVGDAPRGVLSARVRGGVVIVLFEGCRTVADAQALVGLTVYADKADIPLAPGEHFVADVIGMDAVDARDGAALGRVSDVMKLPHGDIYVIAPQTRGGSELLIPARPEFVDEIDIANRVVRFRPIEGMI